MLEPTLLRAGIVLAAAAAAAALSSHVFNELVLDGRYRHLDVDTEWNAWAWVGSATILAAAFAASLCAIAVATRRALFCVLAVWFAFLSLDDVVEVHERLGIRLGSATGLVEGEEAGRLWVVVYLPALAISLLALLRVANQLCGAAARRVLMGGLLLLGVAVAAEIVGAGTRRLTGSLEVLHVAEVAIEEASEVAGWLLLATSLAAIALGTVAAAGSSTRSATEHS